MALDVQSIITEIQQGGASAAQLSPRAVVDYLDLVLAKYAINSNGIGSYTINGRTITRSLQELTNLHAHFTSQANTKEYGGVAQCPVAFRPGV